MNFAQVLVNSAITAAELGIIAIGLTLTLSLLRFANFAHVELGLVGAYLAYELNQRVGLPLAAAIAVGALAAGVIAVVLDRLVFRRFRRSGDVPPMIASLGVAIAIRNLVQAVWGPQFVAYHYAIAPGTRILGAFVTRPQIGIFLTVLVAMLGFHLLLQHTTMGKAMRATAANLELAQASGVDTEKVIRFVWFVGSTFAALGVALVAWDTQLDPQLGFNLVIAIFCVVLIGGVGSVYGAMLGAVVVGLATNLGVALDLAPLVKAAFSDATIDHLRLPVAYKPAIVYAAVILLLLVRPKGLAKREA